MNIPKKMCVNGREKTSVLNAVTRVEWEARDRKGLSHGEGRHWLSGDSMMLLLTRFTRFQKIMPSTWDQTHVLGVRGRHWRRPHDANLPRPHSCFLGLDWTIMLGCLLVWITSMVLLIRKIELLRWNVRRSFLIFQWLLHGIIKIFM